MNGLIHFFVLGHPEPAGSKKAVPPRGGRRFAQIIDANPKAKGWQKTVASTAQGAMLKSREKPLEGPVWVRMVFFRQRPKTHLRVNGDLSLEGHRNPYPATKPDTLKLARAVEDALTGVVYRDDAQIVKEMLWKQWGPREGVEVTVMPL